ncbi:MAG: multiheme c-type cytochrome [bacterium]
MQHIDATAVTDSAIPGDADTADADTADAGPTDAGPADLGPDGEARPLPAPPPVGEAEGALTMTSGACATCHSNAAGATAMRDGQGNPIAPFDLWQATMMANAARDPLWRAVVSAEVAATPAAGAAIEAKCARCHTPAAHVEAGGGVALRILGEASARGELARDGVTCTVCHQITPEGLGTPASFTGGYVIGQDAQIFGPHANPFTRPMQMHTGYTPTRADHITESALCGACHTLETHALTAAGEPTGDTLLEQGTFLEWRASGYPAAGRTCQGCHLPTTDAAGQPIRTAIARMPGGGDFGPISDRTPFGRHLLVGANTLVPALLRDHPDTLRPRAPAAAFDAVIAEARAQLGRAATIMIGPGQPTADGVEVAVVVASDTGHKLPSGFPSRRAWLHVTARDAAGAVVFESGAADDQGRLLGSDGAVQPEEQRGGPVRGPTLRVEAPGQVVVFESLMCDPSDTPTWTLLRGARFCHDTRILPAGWDPDHADARATAPVGVAVGPDFAAGTATARYRLPATAVAVEAQLVYQVLGARFAAEVMAADTPEISALRFYLRTADRRPVVMAEASAAL